nr:hypothetical protein [Tanacetum cinerariifolium]
MATEPNEVRRETLHQLRRELVADVELANNLLHELNRYMDQLRTHAPELLRMEVLSDDPLIKYTMGGKPLITRIRSIKDEAIYIQTGGIAKAAVMVHITSSKLIDYCFTIKGCRGNGNRIKDLQEKVTP